MMDRRVEAAAKALAERATGPGVMQNGWCIIGWTPWQVAEAMLAAADAVDDQLPLTESVTDIVVTMLDYLDISDALDRDEAYLLDRLRKGQHLVLSDKRPDA